jgi:hypothetical protein
MAIANAQRLGKESQDLIAAVQHLIQRSKMYASKSTAPSLPSSCNVGYWFYPGPSPIYVIYSDHFQFIAAYFIYDNRLDSL